jgi:DNA-binding NarL/FixJ family response regulator
MTIIIADDSPILRNRLKSLLGSCVGIEIIGEADNGTEAVRIILEKKPDIAIIDVRMPEMNGIEVLMKLKEMKSKTRICILTNYPYRQYRERCIAEGALHFFDKNQDIQLMIEVMNNYGNTFEKV